MAVRPPVAAGLLHPADGARLALGPDDLVDATDAPCSPARLAAPCSPARLAAPCSPVRLAAIGWYEGA